MRRALVYSHDTFGLGNIRRMLALTEQLLARIPDLSVLLVTGSPVAHGFRLPQRLDYIKLPCLTRTAREEYAVKFLGTDLEETLALRAALVRDVAASFKPDLLLVDKKPGGLRGELQPTLQYLRSHRPETRNVLVLRDILDSPDVTRRTWERERLHQTIQAFYDRVLVLGAPQVFDTAREYAFPDTIAHKVHYSGYLRRVPGLRSRDEIRRNLGVRDNRPLVLATTGGGEDGFRLLDTYLASLRQQPASDLQPHSVVVAGPELPNDQRARLATTASQLPHVSLVDFVDDMMSYVEAADAIVSMGGYNTVCEILTAQKPAVVVPRARPVAEQWIRAERMASLGLLEAIHPDELTPERLQAALARQLRAGLGDPSRRSLNTAGLFHTGDWIGTLLEDTRRAHERRVTVPRLPRLPFGTAAARPRELTVAGS